MEPAQSEALSLETLLSVLRRRGWLVPLCTVLVAAAAFGVSSLRTKRYTATSQLLFRDPGIASQAAGLNATYDPAPERTGATNIRLVMLGDVSARTAHALGLTTGEVSGALSVSGQGDSDIVSVSATSTSPTKAARIANTFSRLFIAKRRHIARQDVRRATNLVEQQIASMSPGQRGGTEGQALQDRLESLKVLASLQTGNVELAQRAATPGSPSSPRTRRNTILGGLLGALLGLGLAFLVERLDRRLRRPEDAAAAFGQPLLGVIPTSEGLSHAMLAGSNGDLRAVLRPGADIEAFRMLRAHLRYFNVGRELKTQLVTSATAGEGKTTVALNLARAAAMADNPNVLLIEADLRRPSLEHSLGLRTPGLADLLVSDLPLEDAADAFVRTVAIEMAPEGSRHAQRACMDVLVAGAIPPNPAQLLESSRMAQLLSAMRQRYDLVVIDTPPLSVVSDAIPIIEEVDGVIVVSRVGHSSIDACRHLRERLENLGAPLLGVVANDVGDSQRSGYAYYAAYTVPREESPVHVAD